MRGVVGGIDPGHVVSGVVPRGVTPAAGCARTHAVDRTAMGDGQNPAGRRASSGIEAGGLAPHLEQGVLDDFVSLVRVGKDPEGDAVRARRHQVVERGERVLVAVAGLDEELVGGVQRADVRRYWPSELRMVSSTSETEFPCA